MSPPQIAPFTSLSSSLDARLLLSLSKLGFTHPTLIQSELIPLALAGRSAVARSKTGSGKTLAYGLPVLQSIITQRSTLRDSVDLLATRCLILVPTRELAQQVTSQLNALLQWEGDEVLKVVNIAGTSHSAKGKSTSADKMQRLALAEKPDVVVATPSRALSHLQNGSLKLDKMSHLVVDEADLILSYGSSVSDIQSILSAASWNIPAIYQTFLMSATMGSDVEQLQEVIGIKDPVMLHLDDKEKEGEGLDQYCVQCTEEDKFLLIYVILKLRLIKGKCLIFVNDTDRSYRLKLFLEKFGIRTGVLNAELPFNSRYHAVQEFNRGVFDYLIATDESGLEGVERDDEDKAPVLEISADGLISTEPGIEESAPAEGSSKKRKRNAQAPAQSSKKSKKATSTATSTEYGVSRGVDFVDVACVINFDLPSSSTSYTHRVGRTARAGRSGMSLSFLVPTSKWGQSKSALKDISLKGAKNDEKIWKRIEKNQRARGNEVKEYRFDMKQVEGFRYRMEDGLKAVTKGAIREARLKEIKNEVMNSDKLKAHFEDNPRDLDFLRHDKPLHPSRIQSHMKHVPSYLMPRITPVNPSANPSQEGESSASTPEVKGFVPFNKVTRGKARGGKAGKSSGRGKVDPLKKFTYKKRT